jgi:hypothetical protein
MSYSNQMQHLSAARHALMLPHEQGEAVSIAHAFAACRLALHRFDRSRLDDDARCWVTRLEELMVTTGDSGTKERGSFVAKAQRLTLAEQRELTTIVDELASWFHREFWRRQARPR